MSDGHWAHPSALSRVPISSGDPVAGDSAQKTGDGPKDPPSTGKHNTQDNTSQP